MSLTDKSRNKRMSIKQQVSSKGKEPLNGGIKCFKLIFRWLESVAAGKPLETEAARSRVAELWALEQELADEAAILQGMKSDKDTIESLLTGT